PTFPVAGGPITYTVTVTNTGPSSAQGVFMTDVLPAEVTATGASGCQVTPSEVTCVIGTMAPGTVRQFVITGTVSPDAPGVITNTASAFGTTPDTNTNNNTKKDQAFVIRSVTLAVTKTHEPQTPTAGQEVTFTIGVTNNGPSRATGVVITDLLPPELTATSASLGCTVTSHLVTCPVGSLEPSKTVEVTVTAMVSPSARGDVTNTGCADSNESSPTCQPDVVTVRGQSVLTVNKSDSPDPVTAGNPIAYTIVVTNPQGPSTAT